VLLAGDNLHGMSVLESRFSGAVDLIYADPPFATGEEFRLGRRKKTTQGVGATAYEDTWKDRAEYSDMLRSRLAMMHRLLADSGSIFLHLDWRSSHHGRLLLDEIFGVENFRNEIVWHYGGRGAKAIAGQFPRNHDTILFYSKSASSRFEPLKVEERLSAGEAKARGYQQESDGRWFKTAPRGDYTDESVARLSREGRIHRTRTGRIRVKYHLRVAEGLVVNDRLLGDVWSDIPDMMHAPAKERTDYPTQKPERLLQRIVQVASKPGDLVADFFCGSGTTLVVAHKMGRYWIGCDQSDAAIKIAAHRLNEASCEFEEATIE